MRKSIQTIKQRRLLFSVAGCHSVIVLFAYCSSLTAGAFLRGDANRDDRVNISDAVTQLRTMFLGDFTPGCEDAADSNDDGRIDIADVLATLASLFQQATLPPPGPAGVGFDPTCDSLGCLDSAVSTPAVVFSEIQYNTADPRVDDLMEFLELHNRTDEAIDVGGYRITGGIDISIPGETVIPARGFLLVLRAPNRWRSNAALKAGPYNGTLSNDGERLTLWGVDCHGEPELLESVKYSDRAPWPIGADGHGPTLERIDYTTPADDFHSWRTSFSRGRAAQGGIFGGGTPGEANSTLGMLTHPTIIFSAIDPPYPTSESPVTVSISLDLPPGDIRHVTLHWEDVRDIFTNVGSVDMEPAVRGPDWLNLTATIPPRPSQRLVRCNFEVQLESGAVVILPHPADPAPVLSYFVYDGEIQTRLPLMWLFPPIDSGVIPGDNRIGGVVIKDLESAFAHVFDGAQLRGSTNGKKLKFLRGAEYRENRTLNILDDHKQRGTLVELREFLALRIYRGLGGLAPWAKWFRVLDDHTMTDRPHAQRMIVQQINERFLAFNGLRPGGDLYKISFREVQKKTNLETGPDSLVALRAELDSGVPGRVRDVVLDHFDLDSVCAYSVGNVLVNNGDAYSTNFFIYNDRPPTGRWKLIPWDLDGTLRGASCSLTAPYSGTLTGPYHQQPELDARYRQRLRTLIAPDGPYRALMKAEIETNEKMLLDDLELIESYLGTPQDARRTEILDFFSAMRTFLPGCIASLESQLGPEHP